VAREGGRRKLIVRIEPALGEAVRLGTAEGPNLVIAGASEEQTWHAVQRFLYRLGCRWYLPGEVGECVPSRPSLSVEPAASPYTPSFPVRVIWYAWGNPDGDPDAMPRFDAWARRNCLTRQGNLAHGHNLLSPIPPDKYFKEHPEYYALGQGQRVPRQPCTTNPEVIRITINHLLAYFRANPAANSYSLCVEDNGDNCQCPNCTALDAVYRDADGREVRSITDRMLVFYNQVTQAVSREFPDKLISIYAYAAMTNPPVREKVHPNLAVLCATYAAGDESAGTAVITQAEAIARATAYTGLPVASVTTATQKQVTDPSVPVADVLNRDVWEVTFTGVTISAYPPAEEAKANPNIHTMRVWLDAQNGALVRAFTPKPPDGGLSRMTGARERGMLSANGLSLSMATVPPAKPLMSILPLVDRALRGSIAQARELVAYFGLLNDTRPTERVIDRPAWLVYLGGISQPFTSGGPIGGPGVGPATEALVVLDATTGEWHTTFLTGRRAP
jgi:hypothetical protein